MKINTNQRTNKSELIFLETKLAFLHILYHSVYPNLGNLGVVDE